MRSVFHVEPSFLFPALLLFFSSDLKEILLFLSAVVFHEAGHLLTLYAFGYGVKRFSLSLSGAAITPAVSYIPYRKEILIYLSGPLGNVLGMLISFFLLRMEFTKDGMLFFFCNLLLFLLNLLPVYGLDGERALSAFLSLFLDMETCEKYCLGISCVALTLLFLFALHLFFWEKNPSLILLTLSLLPREKNKASPEKKA